MEMIKLKKYYFSEIKTTIYKSDAFTINLFRYPTEIEAVEIINTRGKTVILPYFGQIIWDLTFDDIDLKMKNFFRYPKKAECIVDTYGCFAFHSGLLSNGCPGPEDDYPLHGEMPCASMDEAWIELGSDYVKLCGTYEYVKGFGHHYLAKPSVTLFKDQTSIAIDMDVKNLSGSEMPLQYMCHMNYAYLADAVMTQSIPDQSFLLRTTVPDHVKPTEKWLRYNKEIIERGGTLSKLDDPEMYDPEIVFFADHLDQYGQNVHFEIESPDHVTFFTEFSTDSFPYATRWLLYNSDQQVAAFVLPGTCRPEGFTAAKKAGSLIYLNAGEERHFHVLTGKK
ncbi:aldose 1-epimerase family protein [Sporolactobacillus kofuensis]|uniref:Aldose 1-epimerase family protein n=1 Tax=Sporolactobacillus kofuensis TaxID=269672 RepID=A0ABW1WEB2_9BACL|nr:aldose 1-epimerase family protein [Sporolactobacillus kofuensis]MCO7174834.1 aldose 1-epimerase family protein [Sporolactobacillus kofuensis]